MPPPFFSAACSLLQTLQNRAASAPLAPPLFPPARFPLQRACSRSFPNSGSSQFIFGPVASCCRNPWKTGPGVHRVRPLPPFPASSWHQRITKIRADSAPLGPSLCPAALILPHSAGVGQPPRCPPKTALSVHLWSPTPLARRAPRSYLQRRRAHQVEPGREFSAGPRPSSPTRSAPYKTTISRGLFRGLLRDNSAAIPSPLGAK